jgi:MFS family permease
MAETSLDAPIHRPAAAWRHRDYRLFQGARACAIVAAEAQSIAVAWQVYELTRRPLDLGYVGLAQFLPGILLFLVVGHAADRFDRRAILQVCQVGYFFVATFLWWYSRQPDPSVPIILAVMLAFGVLRAFNGPASQSLTPQIVPIEDFQNAVAWGSSIFMASAIIGPALGGVIYAIEGKATLVYVVAMVVFAAALVCTSLMHIRTGRMEQQEMSMGTILAGFKYVWHKKIVLGSISLDLFAVLLGGAVALLPIFANEVLHVGAWGLGVLRSAPALGAALMGGLLAFRPLRKKSGRIMFVCVTIFGAATIAFGLSHSFWISLLALFVVGASDMVSVVIRSTLVQIATPAAMRGRVSAVNLLFIGASNEFGEFESGVTAQWFGAVPAVVVGGIGTLVVVGLWVWLFPELRDVEELSSKHA